MSLQSDLYTVLSQTEGMPPLHPGFAPQTATLPYLVFERVQSGRVRDLRGGRATVESEWQFDGYTNRVAEREALRQLLRTTLEALNFHQMVGGSWVQSVVVTNDFDSEVPPTDGSDEPRRRVTLQVTVWASEALGG